MEFAVVEFRDDRKVKKIVSTKLVRDSNRSPFTPSAAKDFREGELYQVKWQKSDLGEGTDGYFDAEIVCLAGTVESASQKAAEMGKKLGSNPLLELPESGIQHNEPEKCKDVDGNQKLLRKRKDSGNPSTDKNTTNEKLQPLSKKRKVQGHSKKTEPSKPVHKLVKSGVNEKSESVPSKGKQPSNKLMHDPVVKGRLEAALQHAKGNPICDQSGAPTGKTPAEKTDERCGVMGQVRTSTEEENLSNHSHQQEDPSLDHSKRTRRLSNASADTLPASNFDSPNKIDDMKAHNDLTQSDSESQFWSESESGATSSDDDVVKVMDRKAQLVKECKLLKRQLFKKDENEKVLDFMNGQQEKEIDELKLKLASMEKTLDAFKKEARQKFQDKEEEVSALEKKLKQSENFKKDLLALQEDKKCLESEIKYLKKELERSNSKAEELNSSDRKQMDEYRNTLEQIYKSARRVIKQDKTSAYKWESSTPKSTARSFLYESPSKNDTTDVRDDLSQYHDLAVPLPTTSPGNVSTSTLGAVVSPSLMQGPSTLVGKQNKKRDPMLNEFEINLVKDRVMKHMSKSTLLEEDAKGEIDLGFGVSVNKDAFEKNFDTFRYDVDKMAKHLTTMTWTEQERRERSLLGLKNNRFPEATPKKRATPVKVSAILGSIKAHLIHTGQKEGEILNAVLKKCRTSIGAKLNQESIKTQRRSNGTQ